MKYPTRTQIKEIANFVKEACFKSKWKYKKWQWDHVVLVRKHALKLADKVKADKKIVEVAALLHDIGRIKYKPKNHEITSAKETEKILKKLKLDEEFIKKVKAAFPQYDVVGMSAKYGKNMEEFYEALFILAG